MDFFTFIFLCAYVGKPALVNWVAIHVGAAIATKQRPRQALYGINGSLLT
jgi:hypothetical protein